jgi:peptidoglycan/LPS O-acetylase OafA/YrhL
MEKHRNNFDLIRLLAAMQVVYFHARYDLRLPGLSSVDWLVGMFPGVAVFFVISGFLVTKSFIAGGRRVRPYALKRALRIYPALWTNLLLIPALCFWSGALSLADVARWSFWVCQLGQFIFGAEAYGRVFSGPVYHWGGFYPLYPNAALWTIPVELGFYLLVPLMFGALREHRAGANGVILGAVALSLAAAVLSKHWLVTQPHAIATGALGNGPLPYVWMFLLGAGAYLNWDKLRSWFEGRVVLWLLAYLMVQAVCDFGFAARDVDYMHITPLSVVKIVLLAGSVLAFAHSHKGLARVLRGNDLSYGLYLFHLPLFWTLRGFGVAAEAYLWPVAYGGAFALAALSWVLVERSCLRLKPSPARETLPALAESAAVAEA